MEEEHKQLFELSPDLLIRIQEIAREKEIPVETVIRHAFGLYFLFIDKEKLAKETLRFRFYDGERPFGTYRLRKDVN